MTLPLPPPGISLMTDLFSFSEFLKQEKRKDSERGFDSFSISHDMEDVHRNCVRKAVWLTLVTKPFPSSRFLSTVYLGFCFHPRKGSV